MPPEIYFIIPSLSLQRTEVLYNLFCFFERSILRPSSYIASVQCLTNIILDPFCCQYYDDFSMWLVFSIRNIELKLSSNMYY